MKLDIATNDSSLTVGNERWLKRKAGYACGTTKHTVNNISVCIFLAFGVHICLLYEPCCIEMVRGE